jgi:hypothetical protein
MKSRALPVLGILLLAGCIPLAPLPAASTGDRTNLTKDAVAQIAPGKTTRAEVLMALGEADAAALDASWLLYRTRTGLGGTFFVLMSGTGVPTGNFATQDFDFVRLVIHFRQDGVVERTAGDGGRCTMVGNRGPGSRTADCPNIEGTDLPLVRGLR